MQLKQEEKTTYFDSPEPFVLTSAPKRTDGISTTILLFRKHIIKLVILGALSFLASVIFFYYYFTDYSSSVTFLIDDSNPIDVSSSEPERLVISQLNIINKNRIHFLVYSDDMARRLDEAMNLCAHYGIDRKNPDYTRLLTGILREKVLFQKNQLNSVTIKATDKDKEFAASLANKVYEHLVAMNREIIQHNLRYKLSAYHININQYQDQRKQDIEKILQAINQVSVNTRSKVNNQEEIMMLKQDLINLFVGYNQSTDNLQKSQLIYELTSNVIKDTTLQTLLLINKAYPNGMRISSKMIFLYSSLIALLVVLYGFFCIYLFNKYHSYFRLLFKKNLAELPH